MVDFFVSSVLNQVLQLSKRSIIRAIKDNTSVQLPTKII